MITLADVEAARDRMLEVAVRLRRRGVVAFDLAGGEAGTREDGTPYRRLELELSESGELLVNGADISPLLDGLD